MEQAPVKSEVLGTSYPDRLEPPRRVHMLPPFSITARTLLYAICVTAEAGTHPAALGRTAWIPLEPAGRSGSLALVGRTSNATRLRAKVLVKVAPCVPFMVLRFQFYQKLKRTPNRMVRGAP